MEVPKTNTRWYYIVLIMVAVIGCIGVVVSQALPPILGWYIKKMETPSPPAVSQTLVVITTTPVQKEPAKTKVSPAENDQTPTKTEQPQTTPPPEAGNNPLVPPDPRTITTNDTFSPTDEWYWICTGDFVVTKNNGNLVAKRDDQPYTGMIVILSPNNTLTVKAPDGGYCEPFAIADKDLILSEKTNRLLNIEGCDGVCSSITIYQLDKDGNILSQDRKAK